MRKTILAGLVVILVVGLAGSLFGCRVLPEVVVLAFSLGMQYFKPKSAILAEKLGQFGKAIFPLTTHS